MSDIVKRLGDMHALAGDACDPVFNRVLLEARDEIKMLREEVRRAVNTLAAETDEIERLRLLVSDAVEVLEFQGYPVEATNLRRALGVESVASSVDKN